MLKLYNQLSHLWLGLVMFQQPYHVRLSSHILVTLDQVQGQGYGQGVTGNSVISSLFHPSRWKMTLKGPEPRFLPRDLEKNQPTSQPCNAISYRVEHFNYRRIIIGSDRRPETKQGIAGKIVRLGLRIIDRRSEPKRKLFIRRIVLIFSIYSTFSLTTLDMYLYQNEQLLQLQNLYQFTQLKRCK